MPVAYLSPAPRLLDRVPVPPSDLEGKLRAGREEGCPPLATLTDGLKGKSPSAPRTQSWSVAADVNLCGRGGLGGDCDLEGDAAEVSRCESLIGHERELPHENPPL